MQISSGEKLRLHRLKFTDWSLKDLENPSRHPNHAVNFSYLYTLYPFNAFSNNPLIPNIGMRDLDLLEKFTTRVWTKRKRRIGGMKRKINSRSLIALIFKHSYYILRPLRWWIFVEYFILYSATRNNSKSERDVENDFSKIPPPLLSHSPSLDEGYNSDVIRM